MAAKTSCGRFRDVSNDKPQLGRFKEAARQIETDDDEARFNEKLDRLEKQKPDREKGQK